VHFGAGTDAEVGIEQQADAAIDGFRVVEAEDGATGLRLARDLRPDVITLDILMPGLDGWDVLAALKADTLLAAIPVVVVTIVDDRNAGFALGAVDVLQKPVERGHLLEALRRAVRERGADAALVASDDDDAGRTALLADIRSGHNIVSTVFIEHLAMFRADGPDEMKYVGEVEFANGIAAMAASGLYGPTRVAAGIVGYADLAAGASDGLHGVPAGPGDGARLATFWQLAAAVFEAQAGGLLGSDLYTKRIASRLLAQLRMSSRGRGEISDRLAQDLLFFCGHARPPRAEHPAPRLAAVRRVWRASRPFSPRPRPHPSACSRG